MELVGLEIGQWRIVMRSLSSFLCSLFGHEPSSESRLVYLTDCQPPIKITGIYCKRCGLEQSKLLLGD